MQRKIEKMERDYKVAWNKSWLNSVLVALHVSVFQLPDMILGAFIGALPALWFGIKMLLWSLAMLTIWPFALVFVFCLIIVRSALILFIGISGYIDRKDEA